MRVVKRSQMPDGTKIQIEDWSQDYITFPTLTLGAYPIAKCEGNFVRRGHTFRLSINREFHTDAEVLDLFEALEKGSAKLEELVRHFWNLDKDAYLLGL